MKPIIIAAVLIMATVSAHAELFSFYGISTNDPSGTAVSIGEAQLQMEVTTGVVPGQATFLFSHTGTSPATITEIYFDSPDLIPSLLFELLTIDSTPWINNTGVVFVEGANPEELPGGNMMDVAFNENVCVSTEASPPPSKKGVDPGEYVLLTMTYNDSYDLLGMLGNEQLRVGLHVTGIDPYASESFVNNIPEPSTALLLGFVALVGKSYRRIFVV